MKVAKYKNNTALVSAAILAGALFVSFFILVHAQTAATSTAGNEEGNILQGITFPIPELGNCADKDTCRAYCDESAHIDECIKFAKAHGLMNNDEADRAEGFRESLASGGGPGGCTSPRDCRAFCSDTANLEVCVKFAEEHGLKDENFEQGKKIYEYIKLGGQLPGGCNSKESCEKYCGDFSHAQECFDFAQKSGITQVRGEGIPPGQFQKFLELIQKGDTPGGCKSKDECESYCSGRSHFEECVSFGEKAGFIGSDEAEKAREFGGLKGPGECDSPQSCRDYCNDAAHREECFKFAEERGFMSHDEADSAEQGLVTLRTGLDNAPEEVKACLSSVLGPNIIDDIQSGKLVPGPEVGDSIRGCFEKFGKHGDTEEFLKNAPPKVLTCLKEKLGASFDDIKQGKATTTPEMADIFRVCFQSVSFERQGFGGEQRFQEFLRRAPPGITDCLKEKLGDEFDKLESGETQPSSSLEVKLKGCFQEFGFRGEFRRGEEEKNSGEKSMMRPGDMFQNLPENVASCVKAAVGEATFEKISKGELPTSDIKEQVKNCFENLPENFRKPPGGDFAPDSEDLPQSTGGETHDCAQVITPARDPATGACKQFPTPCDVPQGWIKGCDNNENYAPPPTGASTYPQNSTSYPSGY